MSLLSLAIEEINLRGYQDQSVEGLRNGIRMGHRCQVLCSPTGSGKTVIAAYLLKQAQDLGKRAAFVVDRVSLCEQSSREFWKFGIDHGVLQSANTFGRDKPIQVCSAQTVEKRGFMPDLDLLIVDECHAQRKFISEFAQHGRIPVIGLTATPFSEGLGKTYSSIVNVTTTDQLIAEGYLAPLKVYAAREIDMSGAKTNSFGEWSDREIETRGTEIVGDIVSEWVDKTHVHFGGPVKTIAFSATVDHGEQICREFQAAGYNFQQISYRDKGDVRRRELIQSFRDGEILGLVSCEALAKGFDVPDVLCGISARPYRKSFSGHIQQIGRAMRSHPGKEFALWLDHAGNYMGFYDRMIEFFANGCSSLDDGERDNKPRDEKVKEKTDFVCECGYVLQPAMESCPACGKERHRKSTVTTVAGQMVEIDGKQKQKPTKPYLENKEEAWRGICRIAADRKGGDIEAARKFALAQYRNLYDEWPNMQWGEFNPSPSADPRLEKHIRGLLIRYAKGRAKGRAAA